MRYHYSYLSKVSEYFTLQKYLHLLKNQYILTRNVSRRSVALGKVFLLLELVILLLRYLFVKMFFILVLKNSRIYHVWLQVDP